jgi:hypothetical protein
VKGFEAAFSLSTKVLDLLTAPAGYGIAIWILAIIFVWSGVAKLRRPTLTAVAMKDFGVLSRVRPRLGSALGAAELLLALSRKHAVRSGSRRRDPNQKGPPVRGCLSPDRVRRIRKGAEQHGRDHRKGTDRREEIEHAFGQNPGGRTRSGTGRRTALGRSVRAQPQRDVCRP